MATRLEVQALLRFLKTDARLPLATAMAKIKDLRAADITKVEALATCDISKLKAIFGDEKTAKKILNAAKRNTKKRDAASGAAESHFPPKKRAKVAPGEVLSPAELEESLSLPEPVTHEGTLSSVVLFTNRAPLVLAFAITLLKYTMPEQPLSSRLSLAQAVVSVNSRSKAVSLGLEGGKSAEEEGWGEGQPSIRIMNREIRTMRRWGYDPTSRGEEERETLTAQSTTTLGEVQENESEKEPSLWGIDLEALRKSTDAHAGGTPGSGDKLPIYTPQSARAYLLKSFEAAPTAPTSSEPAESPKKQKKISAASVAAQRKQNLGLLLGALDLLYGSWSDTLNRTDLDRRAWGWYVNVRPEVENGVAGWGGKGNVKLADILKLRREP